MGVGTRGETPRGWEPEGSPGGGGGDTGVAPMAFVPGGRQGVGLEDRDAVVGPRLVEGSRLVGSRGGLVWPNGVGKRGKWRG